MNPRSLQPLKRTLSSFTAKRLTPSSYNTSKLTTSLNSNFNNNYHTAFRTTTPKMSGQQGFSNTDTGSKAADPFKKANTETDISLADKVEGLSAFEQACKFSMMTTRVIRIYLPST
jgi:hypothetical protein